MAWAQGPRHLRLRKMSAGRVGHGAALWVLRTNPIGVHSPDIEPVAPVTL